MALAKINSEMEILKKDLEKNDNICRKNKKRKNIRRYKIKY